MDDCFLLFSHIFFNNGFCARRATKSAPRPSVTNQLLGHQLPISSRWLIGHQLPISSRCHITHRQHLVTESCLRNLEARRVRPTVTYPCCRLVSISSLTSKGQHAASSKSKAIPLRGCANTCLGANEPSLLPATLASSCIATSAMSAFV